MPSLLTTFPWARPSLRWAACRAAEVRSASSRRFHRVLAALTAQAADVEPCRLPAPVPLPVRPPRLRVLALLPALVIASLAASPAAAWHPGDFEFTADGRLVDVQILVEGRTAPLYFAAGRFDRRYFQAFRGRPYALQLRNHTGRRIGVLIAVDGLNVVNGERSRLTSSEPMYVLGPWERTVIRGWRSSLDEVRRFVFVDEERSYAERTGQANGDLGWIRVLAFHERGRRWFDYSPGRVYDRERGEPLVEGLPFDSRPQGATPEGRREAPQAQRDEATPEAQGQPGEGGASRRSGAAPQTKALEGAPEARAYDQGIAPSPGSSPGTGWGDRRWDPVRRVWFVPERFATDQLVFRYEYAPGLRALGIIPQGFRDRLWERERGQLGFAQPPRR